MLNKYSSRITQPASQGASQAMLIATGLKPEDLDKPQIGICSVWYEGNPCNMHLNQLGERVKEGVASTGCSGMRFNTIGVSGCIMAMARLNRPAIMVYGGTIKAGCAKLRGEDVKLDIVSTLEAYGQQLAGKITELERKEIVRYACPGAGACGGMYTANTMASFIECMGLSMPDSSSIPAEDAGKQGECFRVGVAMRDLLEK